MRTCFSFILSMLMISVVSPLFGAPFSFDDHFTDPALFGWQKVTQNVQSSQETVSGSMLTVSSITQTPGTPAGGYARVTFSHYLGYNVTDLHVRWNIAWTQQNSSYVQDMYITVGALKLAFGVGDVFTNNQPYLLYRINDSWFTGGYVSYNDSGYADITYNDATNNLTITWNGSQTLYSGSYSAVNTDLDYITMTFQKQIVSGANFGTLSTDRIFIEGNGTPLISEQPVPEPCSLLLVICSCIPLFLRKRLL